MHNLFEVFGRFAVRFRWLILGAWVGATFATVALLPSFSSVIKNENTNFLPANAPSQIAADLADPFVGSSNNDVFVVASNGSGAPLSPLDTSAVDRESQLLARLPNVVSARALAPSLNRRADQIIVLANISSVSDSPAKALIEAVRKTFSEAGAPPGMRLHTAGPLAVAVDVDRQSGTSGNHTQDISLLFIVILLLGVFRSVLAPLATLFGPALVLFLSGPLIAFISEHVGLKISSVTQLLLIVLILGAGTDYGLFLVFRVREEVRRGLDHRDAIVHSLSRVGESITFSATTVIVALLSLLAASFGFYHDLAVPLAIGVAIMLLAGLTLLPAVLAILGKSVFWPSSSKHRAPTAGAWGRVAARVIRRPALTLGVGLAVLGVLAVISLGDKSAGFGGAVNPPSGSDSAAGNAVLAADFPSASTNPTNLVMSFSHPIWSSAELAALQRSEGSLRSSGLFTKILGPLDPNGIAIAAPEMLALYRQLGPATRLPAVQPRSGPASSVLAQDYQAYRSTVELISPDGRTVQFEVALIAGDPGGTAALDAVPAIRAATTTAAALAGADAQGVGGEAPGLYDVSHISSEDLAHIIPISILVIGALLALLLRSLVAPLYLIASVGLSYLAALGIAVLAFVDLGGSGGLTFILPFLMFVFLLALGEDYNILVMSRIREEAHGKSLRQAVTDAIAVTGTTVTSAGLVLAGTFLVFALVGASGQGGSQVRDIGWGLAIGVLMDTFLVRTILVPATVVLLGRANWWPSRLSRQMPEH